MPFVSFDEPKQGFISFDEPVAEPSQDGGFAASVKSGVGSAIKGAGQAAADFIPGVGQDNPVKQYGQSVIDANPTAVHSLEDIAAKPGTAIAEAAGNAGGSVAQMLGARALGTGITMAAPLAGPAAPVVAAVGQAIAWFGPVAVAALPSYGGIRDKQMLNDPAANEDWKAKAIASLGAAAVGAIETKFGPQEWALSALTKEGRAALAKKFAATSFGGSVLKAAGTGALIEGAEELVQNPIEQLASYDDPTTKESLKDTAFGGAMGAIGGGALGGGFGMAGKRQAKADPVKDIFDAPDLDSAIAAANEASRPAELLEAQPQDPLLGAMREREANPTAPAQSNPADLLAGQGDPLAPIIEQRNLRTQAGEFAAAEQEARREGELDAIQQSAADLNITTEGRGERQRATERAADMQAPTALQLAFEKAQSNVRPSPDLQPVAAAADGGGSAVAAPVLEAGARTDRAAGPALEPGRVRGEPDGQPVPLGAGRPAALTPRQAEYARLEATRRKPPEGEPAAVWFGRRGDGYLTQGDASMAIPSRQRVNPDLNWRVEPMPSGKFRLAGYASAGVKSADVGNAQSSPVGDQVAAQQRDSVSASDEQRGAVLRDAPMAADVVDSAGGAGSVQVAAAPVRLAGTGGQAPAGAATQPSAPAVPSSPRADVGNQPSGAAAGIPTLAPEVSRYTGKYGKGMGHDAARLEAARLNRKNDGVTYSAEEHGDAKLENPWAVVGRKAPKAAPEQPTAAPKKQADAVVAPEAEKAPAPVRSPEADEKAAAAEVSRRRGEVWDGSTAKNRQFYADKGGLTLTSRQRSVLGDKKWADLTDAERKAAGEGMQRDGMAQAKEDEPQADEGTVPMFARRGDDQSEALKALSEADELFALPKSSKDTVEGIAADIAPELRVRKIMGPGTESYALFGPNGQEARVTIRRKAKGVIRHYGTRDGFGEVEFDLERPGVNPEDVPEDMEDVYLDVSHLKPGQDGNKYYAIAANLAHNTGRIFIGDPDGLSDVAMRRRLEQMISSALKFGTTAHLAPHPRQTDGDRKLGIPAMRWVYGDHEGNIERMIDVSRKALASAFPTSNLIAYRDGNFYRTDTGQRFRDRGQLAELVGQSIERRRAGDAGVGSTGQAGWRTVARNALFGHLQAALSAAPVGERGGLLDGLREERARLGRDENTGRAYEAKDRVFYRRGDELVAPTGLSEADTAVVIKTFGEYGMELQVADTTEDLPESGRKRIKSEGVKGVRGMYDPATKKLWLVRENVSGVEEAFFVGMHEAFHRGLARTFGADVKAVIDQIYLSNKTVRDKADAFAKKHKIDRTEATEEVLADLAGTGVAVELKGWDRLVKLLKDIIGKIAEGLGVNIPITDKMVMELVAGARNVGLAEVYLETEGPPARRETQEDGTFEPAEDNISFSRPVIIGQTTRTYTPRQKLAMRNVGFEVDEPTAKERAQALWQDAGKKLAQGIVDQFAPVKDLDKKAYGLLRLAKGASGAFEAFLRGGQLKLTDNVYDFDDTKRGGVVDRLLIPLQGEHHDFFRWIAANRAERLMAEGKENLFSAQDIADLKTLADGKTDFDYTVQTGPAAGRVTRDRTLIYADSQRIFNEFNKNALDMAEQSGLIDAASRHLWEHEFYVPFYRVADDADGGIRGMNIKGSVVRQQAFKQLKGGKGALNADLLDNTLMNWAHLLDAAAKNRAAKATLEAAERMGVAINAPQYTANQIGAATGNKNGVVWFMDGGQKRYFVVDDPFVLTAISALEFAGMRSPVMNAMGAFKHALTVGVTASPFFKIRNLIRDSVQVIGTSNINVNPLANVAEGWKLTDPKSDAYFRLMAGGGTIHFGTMLEGSEAKRIQALVESGVDDATILNNDSKVKAFYRQFIEPGITAYNELGNRGEAINRATLYAQLRAQGIDHADASLQARDLMDFSMQGSFTSIRFLTQVVPFFNARLQGGYKLGRAAKDNPVRFGAVLGATAMFSLALLAAYSDDDDWKKREMWDRQNFWWFKFGGTAFRIPKPFEIGAIATLAEHGAELLFDDEMTGKRFRQAVLKLLGDNLSMNPIPQLVKPVLDVYANTNSFTDRPIESLGMERLQSEYRFNDRTSMAARAASTGLNAVTGLFGKEALSPVQIDHLVRGYFGWLGSFVVGAGDVLARPATGQPAHAKPDYWKVATGGMVSDLADAPSRYVSQMYEQAREVEQAYGTWRVLQKEGKAEEAAEFRADNLDQISKYRRVEHVKRDETSINQQIKRVERSDLTAAEKRLRIRVLMERKDRTARRLN
jgi:hypothetical protein